MVTGDWYAALAPAVTNVPTEGCVAIADSKQLYQAGGTLAELERGVLGALESEMVKNSGKPSSASGLLMLALTTLAMASLWW